MGKRRGKMQRERAVKFEAYLHTDPVLASIASITEADIVNKSPSLVRLLEEASAVYEQDCVKVEDLLDFFSASRALKASPYATASFISLRNCYRAYQGTHLAGHWRKRRIARDLGLFVSVFSGEDLIQIPREQRPFQIKMIHRERSVGKIQKCQTISHIDTPGHFLASEKSGFYTVAENESVIFYTYDENGKFNVELAVVRDLASQAPFSDPFYAWLSSVVDDACSERRDVRPNHGGHMAQVGMNTGPRHARVLGWAKSYTKALDQDTAIHHDEDVLGAISIAWSLMQVAMPQEVISHVNSRLDAFGLPRIATRNVEEGPGYHITVGDETFMFPQAERAPSEAYLSRGYEAWLHTDMAYCDYAFVLCVKRQVESYTVKHAAAAQSSRQTRASAKRQISADAEHTTQPGGHFVDASLRVIVHQKDATLMTFKPAFLHGTSLRNGAINHTISVAFSERVADAWVKAQAGISVVSACGAGQGNTSGHP